MSTTISSLLTFKSKLSLPFPRHHQQFPTTTTKSQLFNPQFTRSVIGFSPKPFRFTPVKRFATNNDEAEKELSTMPGRFKDHIKQAPESPFKWPMFVGQFLVFLSLSSRFVIEN